MKRIQWHLFMAISIFFRINVPELSKDGDGDDVGDDLNQCTYPPKFCLVDCPTSILALN